MNFLRIIYNVLFPVVLVALLPGYLLRMMKRGQYGRKFGQRLGFYGDEELGRLQGKETGGGDGERAGRVWVHAVSVGEVGIGVKVIQELRKRGWKEFVLSTTTSTGFGVAEREAGEGVEVVYHPVDFWWVVRKAFRVFCPSVVVLVEAEVWPNMVWEAEKRQVPVVLVNARMSDRSASRYQKVKAIVCGVFNQLTRICLQEVEDREVWRALGVKEEKLVVTGSVKFDEAEWVSEMAEIDFAQELKNLGWAPEQDFILLGGSTHAGEEKILMEIFLEAREKIPGLRLILVPRHAERGGEIESELQAAGLQYIRRSKEVVETTEETALPVDCLLADTTGELRGWYGVANLVFVGKSLCGQGGQNPFEPVHAGVPVILGPYMQNFRAITRILRRHGAVLQIENAEELKKAVIELGSNRQAWQKMVEKTHHIRELHAGATARTVDRIEEVVAFPLTASASTESAGR